jgi:HPt (histidine-containing phosphotransfer) domain-containing protein
MSHPHILTVEDVTVDISMLYEVAGEDYVCIAEMVRIFLKTVPATLKKMETSFEEMDLEGLFKSAHYSKSSLSIIKIAGALDDAKKIEELAKLKSNVNEVPMLLESLERKVSLAEKVLRERFQSFL